MFLQLVLLQAQYSLQIEQLIHSTSVRGFGADKSKLFAQAAFMHDLFTAGGPIKSFIVTRSPIAFALNLIEISRWVLTEFLTEWSDEGFFNVK